MACNKGEGNQIGVDYREVAQIKECLIRSEEVMGSNPYFYTIFDNYSCRKNTSCNRGKSHKILGSYDYLSKEYIDSPHVKKELQRS